MNIYRKLAEGGGYSLPYLLHIYDTLNDIYVINDVKPLEYNGKTYAASSFEYTPDINGAASLDITVIDNKIINILEDNYNFNVEAVGVLYEGAVTPIEQYKHQYGEGSWDGATLKLKLEADDRLDMTFPALIFNSYNNRGNA